MRAETLHRILKDVILDIEEAGVEVDLPKLIDALKALNTSNSEDNQKKVIALREKLMDALRKSRFNEAPQSDKDVLEKLAVLHLVGDFLAIQISEAFEGNEISPSVVLRNLLALNESFQHLYKTANEVANGLAYFDIPPDNLQPGQFEVMVSIPGRAIDNELGQLARETLKINQIIGVFSEIALGTREPIKIRAISTSDPTFFLDSLPAVAALLAAAIERLAALYEKTLTIIKMHREMRAADLPASVLEPLKQHIERVIKDGIEEIGAKIEKEHFKRIEESRKQELRTELRKSLQDIASRLDRGYGFDVRGEDIPPEDGKEDGMATKSRQAITEALRIIEEARPRLRHFEAEQEPILGLSAPADGSDGD